MSLTQILKAQSMECLFWRNAEVRYFPYFLCEGEGTITSEFCGKFYGVIWNMLFTDTALL